MSLTFKQQAMGFVFIVLTHAPSVAGIAVAARLSLVEPACSSPPAHKFGEHRPPYFDAQFRKVIDLKFLDHRRLLFLAFQ